MFDSSIGAGSVLMPYGGKYQLTETQAMVAKVPVQNGETTTVTMMSYGFDPYISSWSPYHGAVYAVTESMARILAVGGDCTKIRFNVPGIFPENDRRSETLEQPFAALLGALRPRCGTVCPPSAARTACSGTFNDIDVPPTLVSFAVDTGKIADVVTPELKKAGDKLVWIHIPRDEYELPVYDEVLRLYGKVHEDMQAKRIVAAYALDRMGMAAAVSKMAFGNGLGVKIEHSVDARDLFSPYPGDLVCEVPAEEVGRLSCTYTVIGEVTDQPRFAYGNVEIGEEEALKAWTGTLEGVFKSVSGEKNEASSIGLITDEKGSAAAWRETASGLQISISVPTRLAFPRYLFGIPGN